MAIDTTRTSVILYKAGAASPNISVKGIFKPNGARIPSVKDDTLEDAKEVVQQTQVSICHPACSLAMKPRDQGGVVDDKLRVYSTKKLRVVDASVFPIQVADNIQTIVHVIAEKAADMIKEDRRAIAKRLEQKQNRHGL